MNIEKAPTINDLPSGFLRDQKVDGLHGLFWPSNNEFIRLWRAADRVWSTFSEEIESPLPEPIKGIFCFDAEKCGGSFAEDDGICVCWGDAFFIGIDKTALSEQDYLEFLLIHELCHALCGIGHTPHYEGKLNEMILQFNHAYGTDLQNDLVTYNDE